MSRGWKRRTMKRNAPKINYPPLTEEETRPCLGLGLGWGPFTEEQWKAMPLLHKRFLMDRQKGLHATKEEIMDNIKSRVMDVKREKKFTAKENLCKYEVGDRVRYRRWLRGSNPYKKPKGALLIDGWVIGHTPHYVYVVSNLGKWPDNRYEKIENKNVVMLLKKHWE